MRDWRAIAKASGLELDDAGPLEKLEEAFAPLSRDLPPGLEPAICFDAVEDPE